MMPGRLLHRLASFLIPADVRERVLDAQLADFQYEMSHLSGCADRRLALMRGYAAYWCALVLCVPAMARMAVATLRSWTLDRSILVVGVTIATMLLWAGSLSWVRTGSVQWAEAFGAVSTAPMWPMLVSMLVIRYCSRRRGVFGRLLVSAVAVLPTMFLVKALGQLRPGDARFEPWANALAIMMFISLASRVDPARHKR
jgi:hypothetical protein